MKGLDPETGWAFSRGEQAIRESLLNVLLTAPGDRIMRPSFGAGILRFLHLPNNETTRSLLRDIVSRAVKIWEPRVDLQSVEVLADPDVPTGITICLRYRVRGTSVADLLRLGLELST